MRRMMRRSWETREESNAANLRDSMCFSLFIFFFVCWEKERKNGNRG